MKPIYKPKGAAGEYADYALNIYTGCTNDCDYCYAPRVLHKSRVDFTQKTNVRPGLIDALERQLASEDYTGRTVHLCFTCDPYPNGVCTTATYRVIEALKSAGCHVQILTKRPQSSKRDWHMLDRNDWIGTTFTGADPWDAGDPNNEPYQKLEPWSENEKTRYEALKDAKAAGLRTWASLEPVIDPDAIEYLIALDGEKNPIDLFKIGKLNYHKSDIDWHLFGLRCEELLRKHGRNYVIKQSLRDEMKRGQYG